MVGFHYSRHIIEPERKSQRKFFKIVSRLFFSFQKENKSPVDNNWKWGSTIICLSVFLKVGSILVSPSCSTLLLVSRQLVGRESFSAHRDGNFVPVAWRCAGSGKRNESTVLPPRGLIECGSLTHFSSLQRRLKNERKRENNEIAWFSFFSLRTFENGDEPFP